MQRQVVSNFQTREDDTAILRGLLENFYPSAP